MDPETAMEIVYDYFTVQGAGICSTHQELHRLSDEAMAAILHAYVEFMVVKALAQDIGAEGIGGVRLAASVEVEDLWRTHLLCTEKYSSFMESINKVNPFVEFINFDPHWALEPQGNREKRMEATRKAYEKLFGKPCTWLGDSETYYNNYKKEKSSFSMFSAIKNTVQGTRTRNKSFNSVHRPKAQQPQHMTNPIQGVTSSKSDTLKDLEIRVVSTKSNKTRFLTINPNDTVLAIKEALQAQDGTPVEQQRLLYAGYELEDALTAQDYGMQSGARIFS